MKSKRRTPQQSKKRPAMAVSMLSMVGAKTVSFLIGFVLGALFFLAIAQEGYLGDVVLVLGAVTLVLGIMFAGAAIAYTFLTTGAEIGLDAMRADTYDDSKLLGSVAGFLRAVTDKRLETLSPGQGAPAPQAELRPSHSSPFWDSGGLPEMTDYRDLMKDYNAGSGEVVIE